MYFQIIHAKMEYLYEKSMNYANYFIEKLMNI